MARLPRGFLAGDVLEQVAQGEAVLEAVVAPSRAEDAPIERHHLVVQYGPGVATPGETGDLEPAGTATVFTFRRIELGVGDPGGGECLLQPVADACIPPTWVILR